jgi:hypothetical protein
MRYQNKANNENYATPNEFEIVGGLSGAQWDYTDSSLSHLHEMMESRAIDLMDVYFHSQHLGF